MQEKPYVLWVSSWYPNKVNPFEGDFIQRHAKASALYLPVTVFHVCQLGPGDRGNENSIQTRETGNLKEIIVFFKYPVTKLKLLDILLYNFRYKKTFKKLVKEYFSIHGLPLKVHVHIPMKAGTIALWILKKWGISYLLTEHSTHYGMGSEDDFSSKNLFHRRLVRKIYRNAENIINVSEIFGNKLKKLFNLQKVITINNTVDTRMFYLKPEVSDTFRFIHVSSLDDKHKNISGILKAIKELSMLRTDFQIIVVGPHHDSLFKLVKELEIERLVHFAGEVSYQQVSDQMKKASAFVLFSWYENSPCVIGESLCCGLPVISSDTGGVNELVNSSNGILVSPGDITALAMAMENMMNNYSSYDRSLIAAEASVKFSFDTIGKKIAELYTATNPV